MKGDQILHDTNKYFNGWRCHCIPCVHLEAFFRSSGKKGHLEKYYFRYCYGNFCGILNVIWSHLYSKFLFDNYEARWQEHFEQALQMKILWIWINTYANSFTKTWVNTMKQKSAKASAKLSLAQKIRVCTSKSIAPKSMTFHIFLYTSFSLKQTFFFFWV